MVAPTYPLSTDVVATQRTLVTHYNNLRKDALYMASDTLNSILLGNMLARYSQYVTIEYLATNRLRVPVTATHSPTLVIAGQMNQNTSAVDLAPGLFSGAAAKWYVFAVHTDGLTTFTLSVNTSPTEATGTRLIGECYWDGTNLDQGSIKAYELDRPGYTFIGIDAEKHTVPAVGDTFYATDLKIPYVCFVAGTWTRAGMLQTSVLGVSDINTSSQTMGDMTDMSITLTASGNPILILFEASILTPANTCAVRIVEDTTTIGSSDNGHMLGGAATLYLLCSIILPHTPAAGSHVYKVQWKTTSGTAYQYGSTYSKRKFTILGE